MKKWKARSREAAAGSKPRLEPERRNSTYPAWAPLLLTILVRAAYEIAPQTTAASNPPTIGPTTGIQL